jgi:hypothetical protein
MVDFNSENILVADKSNLMNIRIIEKDYYVVEALEKYDRLKFSNASAPAYIVKASIRSLYNTCRANLKNTAITVYEDIEPLLNSKDFDDFLKAYELLGDWLYYSGVIKFINKKNYNPRRPLEEAKAKGVS